jgi:hypothetical protein
MTDKSSHRPVNSVEKTDKVKDCEP